MKRGLAVVVALLAGCALLACGSGDGDPLATSGLAARVAAVRDAAEKGDAATARAALVILERDVTAARESGALDDARAGAILAAANDVEKDLGLLDGGPATTTTRRTTTTTVPATPVPTRDDKEQDDDDDNRGKDHGKDAGKDEGHKGDD